MGVIGTGPEEEEDFLLSVSGAGINKLCYVNLNGAPMRDVLFWDYLMQLEASRTFREILKTKPMKETFMSRTVFDHRKKELENKSIKSKILKAIKTGNFSFAHGGVGGRTFRFFSAFLEDHLINNKYIDALPRWFIYPIIQNLLYFEFKVQGLALKIFGRRFNLYENRKPQANYLPEDFLNADRIKDRSLRSLVATQRLVPDDVTEKNRQIFARGL